MLGAYKFLYMLKTTLILIFIVFLEKKNELNKRFIAKVRFCSFCVFLVFFSFKLHQHHLPRRPIKYFQHTILGFFLVFVL